MENLASVFRDKYNYDVSEAVLEQLPNGQTQVDLNDKLTTFIKRHNDENTLMIIYYAGHGLVDGRARPGVLQLSPYQTPTEMKTDEVVWNTAGKLSVAIQSVGC